MNCCICFRHYFIKYLLCLPIIGLTSPSVFGDNVLTHSIYFAIGSAEIDSIQNNMLYDFMVQFDTLDVKEIKLFGYCDPTGSVAQNLILSTNRTETVLSFLEKEDLYDKKVVVMEGRGEVNEKGERGIENEAFRKVDVEVIYSEFVYEIIHPGLNIGDTIILENVLFQGGRKKILHSSRPTLDLLVANLLKYSDFEVEILGHICCKKDKSDGVDLDTFVFNLSEVRARSIYDYLVRNGVKEERLSYKGLKALFPTGKGNEADRRVELHIVKK